MSKSAAPGDTRIQRALRDGGVALGTWLSLASTGSAEMLANTGLDWLLIDQQHTSIGPSETLDLIRAVNCGAASPVVRIPTNARGSYDQALDSGAHAIMVPGIESVAEAQRAVACSSYPPLGERSTGGYRAQYSFHLSRPDYLRLGPPLLILQIEHIRAVERIDEIVLVEGVDAFFIGPQDLSSSMGLPPSLAPATDAFEGALQRVREACMKAMVPLGILVPDVGSARQRLREGFRIVAVSTDAAFVADRGQDIVQSLRTSPGA